MKMATIGLSFVLALWAILAVGSPACAGTVGKVNGKVVDARGEPLPGASVVLEGTRKGAVTDKDGTYLILLVDPGVYSATASLIGFHSITKREVLVRQDFTTTVNFQLQEKAVELKEVVVQAERPPVEPDKTESRYVVTAKDIAQTPILRNVTEFVALEPGMSKDGTMVIRSGQVQDNAVFVDGVRLQNQDGRVLGSTGNQWWGVNVNAVQEIAVITGGMNAEYGNAQAGVVNMITRDGSEKYHGELEYRLTPASQKHWGANVYDAPEHRGHAQWNNPTWVAEVDPVTGRLAHQRVNYTDWRGHLFNGYLSGPLTKSAFFFGSVRYDRQAAVLPGAWSTIPPNLRTTAKLTIPVGPNVKLRFGWVRDRIEGFNDGSIGFSTPNVANTLRAPGRDIFLPGGSPAGKNLRTENAFYAVMTHTLSPRTFYELRVSRYQSREDTSGVPNGTSDVRTDKEGWFYLGRNQVRAYEVGAQKRTGLKFDLSSQVTKGHFLKSGFDFTAYSNHYKKEGYTPGNARKQIAYIGNPEPGNPIKPVQFAFYVQDKMEFEGFIVNAGLRYDRFWGVKVPLVGAYRALQYNTMARFLKAPRYPMKPIVNWSPRVGISHPITSKSSLHFFYGHFYQIPSFNYMFHDQWFATTSGTPGVPFSEYASYDRPAAASIIRPVWDNTQRTINFELGADWNLVSDYTIALATFYKSASFQESGGWDVFRNPANGGMAITSSYSNIGVEDTRGFEFSLRKAFSHYTAFRAAFNLGWGDNSFGGGGDVSNGATVLPDSTYIASGRYFTQWTVQNGVEQPVPLTVDQIKDLGHKANNALRAAQMDAAVAASYVYGFFVNKNPVVKAWEQSGLSSEERAAAEGLWIIHGHNPNAGGQLGRRSQGSLQVFFSSPSDFGPGPKVAGGTPLGGINANLIYRIYSGSPFTYLTIAGKSEQARGPLHTMADLHVQKSFRFGGLNADLFLEIFNLFNQKDPVSSAPEYMWWGLLKPPPDDANYQLYGDFQDRTRYLDSPRVSHVGIRFRF
jgi:hypothetical protein